MGLYGKGDRAEWAQVGRLEERVNVLEGSGSTPGTPVDAYTKTESDNRFLNKLTGGLVTGSIATEGAITAQDTGSHDGNITAANSVNIGTNQNGNSAIAFNFDIGTSQPGGQNLFFDNTDSKFKIDLTGNEGYALFNDGENKAAHVAKIADPSTATAEDVANRINSVIQALIDAGLMA